MASLNPIDFRVQGARRARARECGDAQGPARRRLHGRARRHRRDGGARIRSGGRAPAPPRSASARSTSARRGFAARRLTVPLERADPSLGTIPIRFAVRRRGAANRPSRRHDLRGRGRARVRLDRQHPLLHPHARAAARAPRPGHRRHARHRPLAGDRLPGSAAGSRLRRRRGLPSARASSARRSPRTGPRRPPTTSTRSARALGLERISIYGDSYGTFLGQSYAYRHGETLDALVLDGAYPVRGESGWYPSLTRTGIRSLAIVCRRSNRCSGPARKRLAAGGRAAAPDAARRRTAARPRSASSGYEPPSRYYMRVNDAVSAYLAGDRRPMRRLTRVGDGGYGSPRSYSRGDELAVSCNDYSMLWDKAADDRTRRAQQRAAIRSYPRHRFHPFTPREVALRELLDLPDVPPVAAADGSVRAPGAARAPSARRADAGDLRRARRRHQRHRGRRRSPPTSRGPRFSVVRNAGHVPSLYGGRYPARDWVREFLLRHG